MNLTSWLILAGAVVVFVALVILVLAMRYRKVGPNEALIIAGGRKRTITLPDGTKQKVGYRYRLGGGVFVWPGMEKVYVLPMDIIPVTIRTPEVLTHGGVPILAEASAQVKVDSSDEAVHRAAEQFLGIGRDGIRDVAVNVLEGKVREVIGGMSVEEIYRGRQEFSSRVVAAVQADFARMGLVMLSFALKDISDTQGYIDSLSKPQIAAAKRDAAIAQAETEKESIIKSSQARKEAEVARLQSEALIAKAQWENEAKKAESQVFVNTKKAQADFSYELERQPDQPGPEEGGGQGQAGREGRGHQDRAARDLPQGEGARGDGHQAGRRPQVPDQGRGRGRGVPHLRRGQGQGRGRQARGPGRGRRDPGQGRAEAEAMTKKAAAYEKYTQAAVLDTYIKVLPELARAVSEPLSKVDKIVIVGGDKELGTTKITAQVAQVLAQMPDVVKSLTGADIREFLKAKLSPEVKDAKK